MGLELTQSMENQPGHCTLCQGTPYDMEGKPLPAVHAVGVDVNWGDDVYVCAECCGIISDLTNRVTVRVHDTLLADFHKLEDENDLLRKNLEKANERLEKITEGKRAQAQERAVQKKRKAA